MVVGSTVLWITSRGRVFAQPWTGSQLGRCTNGTPAVEALQYPGSVRGAPDFDFIDRFTHFVPLAGRLLVVRRDGEVSAVALNVTSGS